MNGVSVRTVLANREEQRVGAVREAEHTRVPLAGLRKGRDDDSRHLALRASQVRIPKYLKVSS